MTATTLEKTAPATDEFEPVQLTSEGAKPVLYAGSPEPDFEAPVITRGMSEDEIRAVLKAGRAWIDPSPEVLKPNVNQPRKQFDDIPGLAISILMTGMSPRPSIRYNWKLGHWEIVDGERRDRAILFLNDNPDTYYGLMPVDIDQCDDVTALKRTMAASSGGRPLNVLDEATGYQKLMELGSTQEEIGKLFDLSQAAISNRIRLLALPEVVQLYLRDGSLSTAHGVALLGLGNDDDIKRFAFKAKDEKWNTKLLEENVRTYKAESDKELNPPLFDTVPPAQMAGAPLVSPNAPAPDSSTPASTSLPSATTAAMVADVLVTELNALPDNPDETAACATCGKTDTEVQAAGEHMTKFDLCSACDPEHQAAQAAMASDAYNEAPVQAGVDPDLSAKADALIQDMAARDTSQTTSPASGAAASSTTSGSKTPAAAPTTSPAAPSPAAPKTPAGYLNALVPEGDYNFCKDAGLAVPQVFALAREVLEIGKEVGITHEDVIANMKQYFRGE